MLVVKANVNSESSEPLFVPSLPVCDIMRILQLDNLSDSKLAYHQLRSMTIGLRGGFGFLNDPTVQNVISDSAEFAGRLECFLLDKDTIAFGLVTNPF